MRVRSIRLAGLAVCLSLSFVLAACQGGLPFQPTPLPPTASPTLAPLPTPTPAPTPTLPPLVLFITPDGSDPALNSALQTLLTRQAGAAGIRLQMRLSLEPAEVAPNVRAVVAVAPDPGLAALAAANPKTQFLAIGIPNLKPAQNLSVLSSQGEQFDRQGFLAGYLAALISSDWRVGMVTLKDSDSGKAARQAFYNGVIYYCGLCRPTHPPFYQYPLYAELAENAAPGDQQGVVDYMVGHMVKNVYVFPGAGGEKLLAGLAQAKIGIIGGVIPPDNLKNQWVASIHTDLLKAVEENFPKVLQGQPVSNLSLPMLLTNQNETLLSAGRQRMVNQTLNDLTAGFIDPGASLPASPAP